MNAILFGVYQFFSVALFLFLSAALLYHHRVRRWLWFTFCFFLIYLLGGYFFFGRAPSYFPADFEAFATYWVRTGSILLLVFGFFGVIGYSMFAGHTSMQRGGAVLVFLAVMGALMTVIHITIGYGVPGTGQ